MNRQREGFTIIEVMLVLAIAGLMMIGILASANQSISQQRYRDATESLVSYFQSQYSQTVNVRNNRPDTQSCGSGGIATNTADKGRGTSECTFVGRLLQSDGKTITSRSVYGVNDISDNTMTSDKAALQAIGLLDDPTAASSYELGWSTAISAKGSSRTAMPFSMAILRSPNSGTLHTFVLTGSGNASVSSVDLVNSVDSISEVVMCVDPKGLLAGEITGVKITKDASSVAGVLVANGADCA